MILFDPGWLAGWLAGEAVFTVQDCPGAGASS